MNPPANWYPDPTGRHDQRYWDGEQWTEHVFTDGVQDVDPLDQAGPADGSGDEEERAVGAGTDQGTSGLFEDANGEDAWTPQDGDGEQDAEAVASPATGDMSDAFVLAPETASRIVKRRAAEAGDAAQTTEAAGPAPAPVAPDAAEGVAADTGVIDAPPPTADAPPTAALPPTTSAPPATTAAPPASTLGGAEQDGDLGITGDLLGGAFAERSGAGPVALQNSRLLRCSVSHGDAVVARQGTMVAYQGDVSFDRQGAGGVTKALKRAATGEGLAMMRAEGSGDVFFADGAQHVFLLQLAGGPGLSVNGRNVLAFSATLAWDIQRVKGASLLAGGLFNTTFTGTGWVALVSDGEPVVLHTDEAPTHVDVNALVAWSAGLSTRIVNSASAKSLVGLGSGEAFQMAFDGPGIVIVQPSEGPLGGAAAT